MGEFYVQNEYWLAVFQLVTAMLGMGASLTVGDFREIAREPRAVATGIALQLILVPAAAFIFIYGLGLTGGLALGVAIIAAIPGGAASNIFTLLARGNFALSIAITAVTTLACLVSTPLVLDLLASGEFGAGFEMPRGQVVRDIALTLLLPLGIGMTIRRLRPTFAAGFSTWSIRASIFGLFLIVVGSLSAGRLDLSAFEAATIFSIAGLALSLLALSLITCRIARLSPPDQVAIGIEVVFRNINLGLLIKASLFPIVAGAEDPVGDMVLFTLLFFGLLQLILTVVVVGGRRLQRPKAADTM